MTLKLIVFLLQTFDIVSRLQNRNVTCCKETGRVDKIRSDNTYVIDLDSVRFGFKITDSIVWTRAHRGVLRFWGGVQVVDFVLETEKKELR